jgi:hypothetical protein
VRDPTRRLPGSWPRDRPIRWRGVAGGLAWFAASSVAGLLQLGLVVPVLAVASSAAGEQFGGVARIGLAVVWGGLTLFAGWSWLMGRWRIVLAPVITVAVLVFVLAMRPA